MTTRRDFLQVLTAGGVVQATGALSAAAEAPTVTPSGADDRAYWVAVMGRLADPVLTALAAGQLKQRMPVESKPGTEADRRRVTYLEAFGRLLAGMAPWLEVTLPAGPEAAAQRRFVALAQQGLEAATNPASPDVMNFNQGSQPLVDAAFLAHAILRAPRVLWQELPASTRGNLVTSLRSTRVIRPGPNNWLLFSAMVEAALAKMGESWDQMRVDYALRQHEQWFVGDGMYGDGPQFHWDYYNSFVIQPMLLDVLATVGDRVPAWAAMVAPVRQRATRHAAIQERLISPEGTLPPIGRSLAYRFGALQLLGQVALRHELPAEVAPAQVRCGMTAVVRRMTEAAGTFTPDGWLTIGLAGHQPGLGESYISTGSLYLTATGLLPLGLPPADPFWSAPAMPWTAQRVYGGENVSADKAG
ncbi:MAG TPA: DUF2264 domain-containing protein [Gemmatimonadales bacterium]|jgi:hypothetical protein|nr:DUF2264 domain-containing protein [Gemmatimonadales bacterium]